MKKRIAIGAALLLAPAPAAHAAEAGPNERFHLAPIVVTAEKMEQDVQRIPASVAAVTADDLEEKHVQRFYEVADYVPNVFVKGNSTENIISIRGISPMSGSLYSATGMYVDGVNYPIHQTQDLDFLDVDRVEVLKGPQGALYGRNTEAGVVNVITAAPTADAFSGRAFADLGMWDSRDEPIYKLGGMFNLPLAEDKLAMKLALQGYGTGGWMENVGPSGEDDAARKKYLNGHGVLRWTPDEAWDMSFILRGMHKTQGLGVYRFIDGPYATNKNEIAWDGPNRVASDMDSEILKVEHRGDAVDVTSVTARHSFSQNYAYDTDMTPFEMGYGAFAAYYDVETWSEEFRVASKPGENSRFDWLAGLFLNVESLTTANYSVNRHVAEQDNWGAALFGQGTWHMGAGWHLNAGARVEFDRLEGKKTGVSMMGMPMHFEDTAEETVFLPSIGLSYDITDNVMAYVKASRGYLAGGFDAYFAETRDLFSYDPEYSWNFEAGLKNRLWDDRLILNAAVFYIDSDDKQVTQFVSPYERYMVNAASVEAYGAEFDVQVRPMRGLTLTGSLGLLNSEFKDWTQPGYMGMEGPVPAMSYDGLKMVGAPEVSWSVGAMYRSESGWYVGADALGVSSFYANAENNHEIDGRALINARAGWENDALGFMLWAKNLFDEEYEEHRMTWMGGTLVQPGEPRSFGLLMQYKW